MADTYLDVVDEDDRIVGQQLRSIVHRDGLLHREIHVWFLLPSGLVVLQRRSATKDTFPAFMDVTVGGHVEQGQDYVSTAIAETFEETGIILTEADLLPIRLQASRVVDPVKGAINNARRMVYAHRFQGYVDDLVVEAGDGAGFETLGLDEILIGTSRRCAELVPATLEPDYAAVLQGLKREMDAWRSETRLSA